MKIKNLLFGPTTDASPATLLLRLFTGAALMTHGVPKMFGGLSGFTSMVDSLGIPLPNVMAFLAAFAECFGALFLLLGLFTRASAFLVFCTMGVAAFVAHGSDPFAKKEMALLYFFVALFFMIKGAGAWSLDRLVARR